MLTNSSRVATALECGPWPARAGVVQNLDAGASCHTHHSEPPLKLLTQDKQVRCPNCYVAKGAAPAKLQQGLFCERLCRADPPCGETIRHSLGFLEAARDLC